MLSIIICSRDATALRAISVNVEATIGVPYEIIGIDNSGGQYSICEAYNLGASQSQYELLCFMHEDIRFHTLGWGEIVTKILADKTIGVLGVTGGMYQVKAPAAWWGCGLELCRENVLDVFDDGHQEIGLRNPNNVELADVAVVDGLWMCSRKEVWQNYPFDANIFSEFHFYDVDYCTEIFQHYRVCVTYQVLIEHHSRGSINTAWLRNALKYQEKRHNLLHFGTVKLDASEQNKIELRALQEFTGRLIHAGFSPRLIGRYLLKCLLLAPLNKDSLWLVKQFMKHLASSVK